MTTVLPRPSSVNRPSRASQHVTSSLTYCHASTLGWKVGCPRAGPLGTLAAMTTVGTPLPVSLVLPGDTGGLSTRPLTRSDAAAVTALMAACEQHDVGDVLIEEADIVGDWQRPALRPRSQSVGVLDGERLVAYAEVYKGRWADAAVDPALPRTRHRDAPVALDPRRRRARRRHARRPARPRRLRGRAAARLPRLPHALDLVGPRDARRAARSTPSPSLRAMPSASRATRPTCEPTWTVNEDAFLEWSDARARDLRGVGGERVAAARLPAVAAAPHGRPR